MLTLQTKPTMSNRPRLTADNPHRQLLIDTLHDLRKQNKFSFHKPDTQKWDFKPIYAVLNEKIPGFTKTYSTAAIRPHLIREITDWIVESGEQGKRPGE